jgi:hypothetical protein
LPRLRLESKALERKVSWCHLSRIFSHRLILSQEAIYWREAISGHSRSAYFVGKVMIAIWLRLTISALHFTALYAVLATPIIPFGILFVINLVYFYCTFSEVRPAHGDLTSV